MFKKPDGRWHSYLNQACFGDEDGEVCEYCLISLLFVWSALGVHGAGPGGEQENVVYFETCDPEGDDYRQALSLPA